LYSGRKGGYRTFSRDASLTNIRQTVLATVVPLRGAGIQEEIPRLEILKNTMTGKGLINS